MKLDWLCAEKATAVSLGCAGLMLADGGLMAGGAIAGAGLLGLWNKARRADGVNSEKLLADARAALLADYASWAEGRDLLEADLKAADHAMDRHLFDCVPPVAELAQTMFTDEAFPAHAARLVVDRLADRNVIFSETHGSRSPVAREFALLVMTSALTMAKEQPAFLQRLTQEIVLLLPQHLVRIESAVKTADEGSQQRDAALIAQVARLQATLENRFQLPGTVLRDTIMQELTLRPGLNDGEVAEALQSYCAEHKRLEQRLTHLEVFDNRIAALKADAEAALKVWDHIRVAELYAEMRAITDERNCDGARRAAEFAKGETEALMMTRDWQAALMVWQDAAAKLHPYDAAAADAMRETAGRELLEHGKLYPGGAIAAAVEMLANVAEVAQPEGETFVSAARKLLLGNALLELGERSSGVAGLDMIARAVSTYEAVLAIITRRDLPTDWAMTQNNLGNALTVQGHRSDAAEGVKLFARATRAYEAALEVFTRAEMPADWAMTQNNLGTTLMRQGERSDGQAGLELLSRAISIFQATLEVYSRADMPVQWAGIQNNLGLALQTQGERRQNAAAVTLLASAVHAYEAALGIYTIADMPTQWAMVQNNLGLALQTQGERSSGETGLDLLACAISAFEGTLEIHSRAYMPADWAMTQSNLGIVFRVLGERISGAAGLDLLARSVLAYEAALDVRTRAEMPVDWAATTNNLGNTLRVQGERLGGEAGLGLLARAVGAFESALEVYTRADMPTQWAMMQQNIALTEESRGDLATASAQLAHWRSAEETVLLALEVYDVQSIAYYFTHACALLERVRSKIAGAD